MLILELNKIFSLIEIKKFGNKIDRSRRDI